MEKKFPTAKVHPYDVAEAVLSGRRVQFCLYNCVAIDGKVYRVVQNSGVGNDAQTNV
jgi:hypothetical protein